MTKRIATLFSEKKAHVAYLTVGDGGMLHTEKAAMALIKGGVNLLELGMPFSDPIADGPVIQRATSRALAAHITLEDVLSLIISLRKKTEIPIILFSYLNPILKKAQTDFFKKAQQAGLDGVLIVDCPIEETPIIQTALRDAALPLIYIIAENTPIHRIETIAKRAEGFLYYACRKGTTGMQKDVPIDFSEKISIIRKQTSLPVVVGFGVSNRKTAARILKETDGVVIGSFFVALLEKNTSFEALTTYALQLYGEKNA